MKPRFLLITALRVSLGLVELILYFDTFLSLFFLHQKKIRLTKLRLDEKIGLENISRSHQHRINISFFLRQSTKKLERLTRMKIKIVKVKTG